MNKWPVQDAKAKFSELLDSCVTDGPQMMTKRGTDTAALVSVEEWQRLQAASHPSLKQLLLSDSGRAELMVPARGRGQRRQVNAFQ